MPTFARHMLRRIVLSLTLLAWACVTATPGMAVTALHFSFDRAIDGTAAPFVVASTHGLFRAEGLNVTTGQANGSVDAITRVASGSSDIALADINALIRYRDKEGVAPVKAVFVLFNRAPYAIVARRSRGVASLTDLPGKTLGVAEGDLAIRLWPALARDNGIEAAKIRTERIGAAVREPMLSAGQVDAVSGLSFGSAVNLRDRGVPAADLVVFSFADYGSPAYGSAIIVNPSFAAASPQAVRDFLVATIDGVRASAKNPASAIDTVLARLDSGVRELELERLRTTLRGNILTDDVRREGLGAITPERFDASIEAIGADYKFRRRPVLTDIFDGAFLPPASARKVN